MAEILDGVVDDVRTVPHGCENSGGPKTFSAKIHITYGKFFFPGLAYAICLSLTARLSAEFVPGPRPMRISVNF